MCSRRYCRRLLQMGCSNTELWNNLGLCCFYASQYDMTLSCFEKALAMANDDNMADVWSVCTLVFRHAGIARDLQEGYWGWGRVGRWSVVRVGRWSMHAAACSRRYPPAPCQACETVLVMTGVVFLKFALARLPLNVWDRYNIGQVAIGIADLGLAYQAFKIAVSINSHHAESFNNLGVLELRKGNIEQARSNFSTAASIAPFMFESFFNAGECRGRVARAAAAAARWCWCSAGLSLAGILLRQ